MPPPFILHTRRECFYLSAEKLELTVWNFEEHELEPGLGLDRRLVQGRRRVRFNPEKKTPDMRHLEQQYAASSFPCPLVVMH